jgi:phosphatidylglycerophosphatase C
MNLALFDFDGTITSTDTWTPFMRLAVPPARMAQGRVLLAPVVIGYRLGMVSSSTGRRIAARVGFRNAPAATVRQLGDEYAARVLPTTLRESALARIEWHKSQGDVVVVVSAALEIYLGSWCRSRNLPYICTTLEEHEGRLTGRYVDGDCSGAEKARRILQQYELPRYPLIYAYGDSGEDREMLALANRKYYRWKEIAGWHEVTSYSHPGQ